MNIKYKMTSIIVINYKNELLTADFVTKEVRKFQHEKLSVVVVNNGATDDSNETLSRLLQAPVVASGVYVPSVNNTYIISSKENLGFARGNNLGAEFASRYINADYLLFSNNDIQITQSDTVEVLVNTLEEHPEVGLIGPKVVGLKGELQSPEPYQSFWDRYVWMYLSTPFMNKTRKQERFNLNYAQKAKEGYHYKVMGSFFMLRTKDYFDCGGMDPQTFLYAEETILSERLKSIGKKVYYCPRASVIHAHGATTSKSLGKKGINKYRLESDTYYYSNYMNEPKWKLILGMTIFKLLTRLK